MAEYHEPTAELSSATRNFHRALHSLVEELEAVDWYQQRIDAGPDDELREILEHNRNEEIEHASMLIEWLRRRMPGWEEKLKTYLFSAGRITEIEEEEAGHPGSGRLQRGELAIGAIK